MSKKAKKTKAEIPTLTTIVTEAVEAGIEAEDKKPKKPMSIALAEHRGAYTTTVSYLKKPSMDNNDELAKLLRGMSPEQVVALAERILDMVDGELMTKYGRLNKGQKRMNAGNRIRGAMKRQDVSFEKIKEAI